MTTSLMSSVCLDETDEAAKESMESAKLPLFCLDRSPVSD